MDGNNVREILAAHDCQENTYQESEKALQWLLPFPGWKMNEESKQAKQSGCRKQFDTDCLHIDNPEFLDSVNNLCKLEIVQFVYSISGLCKNLCNLKVAVYYRDSKHVLQIFRIAQIPRLHS